MVTIFQRDVKDIPTQKVIAMRKQGLTDNQIIQSLQHEGFDSQNVLEALEMADVGQSIPDLGNNIPQNQMQQQPRSIVGQNVVPKYAMPPPMGMPGTSMSSAPGPIPAQLNQPGMPQMAPPQKRESDEDIEELIEAIIDEKWAEVEKDISRVLEWKDSVDEKLGAMEADIKDLQKNFDDLHKAILGKVGDYDKNILNVGTQLKAMEQVFSKVLPTFTDNVSELNRIADKLRKSKDD